MLPACHLLGHRESIVLQAISLEGLSGKPSGGGQAESDWLDQPAAAAGSASTSGSASGCTASSSTETRFETPRSCMVTP